MAFVGECSTSGGSRNPSVILDSSSIQITSNKFNGSNYLQWSQSVMLFVCGRAKDEFLSGDSTQLKTSDPTLKAWRSENSMVMSWLINSMTTEIGENFLLYTTAKDIWEAARDAYTSR